MCTLIFISNVYNSKGNKGNKVCPGKVARGLIICRDVILIYILGICEARDSQRFFYPEGGNGPTVCNK